jgi:hypothetical protein
MKGMCLNVFPSLSIELPPRPLSPGTTAHICWLSFSSASQSQAVAESFSKGTAGTLFFLYSSTARPISSISHPGGPSPANGLRLTIESAMTYKL